MPSTHSHQSTPGSPADPSAGAGQAVAARIAAAVAEYRDDNNFPRLFQSLDTIAADATPDELVAAAEPFRDVPEVAGPIYEKVVAARPTDARALVILASSYWLTGRGPDVVGELAARAMSADPSNRGAWHLWALTESDPRGRVSRWRQVSARFPDDLLALANLADNAASLAGAEHDEEALALAIASYEALRRRAEHPQQREALDTAIRTLKGWKL